MYLAFGLYVWRVAVDLKGSNKSDITSGNVSAESAHFVLSLEEAVTI